MVRNIDGVSFPEKRKSIRNIPIPEGRRKLDREAFPEPKKKPVRANPVRVRDLDEAEEEPVVQPIRPKRPRSGNGTRIAIVATTGIVIVAFSILSLFRGGTLSYVPRSIPLSFNGESFDAAKTAGAALTYSVVKLSGDKSATLPATGSTQVSRKASGTIVVYNNASSAPQPLVENTRFQSSDGKVYRIQKAITVPGKTGDTPGSVEATVYADEPGDSYNIGLTDFTLPGLKGTPKYQTVYARSKTPMSGGFVGTEKAVNPSDLSQAKASLSQELSKELVAKAQAEVPADFILYPSLTSVAFEDLPQTPASGNTATINLRGNLVGVMFKRSDLSAALAAGKASISPHDQVDIDALDSLTVSFAAGAPADLLNADKLSFKVTGSGNLLWKTDEVALKRDLAGTSKAELGAILKNYPTIASATATLRPFWQTSFPADASEIAIKKVSK